MEKAVIDAIIFVERGLEDRHFYLGDKYSPELIADKIRSVSPESKIFYSIPDNYEGILKERETALIRTSEDDLNFWKNLFSRTGSFHIAKIMADSPFIDSSVIDEMFSLHLDYLAEFTFSENLPEGLSCEIISSELLDQLPETEEKTLPLGRVVKSNINQFDVELYYRDPDIRDKRLSFRLSEPGSRKVMENIFSIGNEIPSCENIKNTIDNNPHVLFTAPSYIELEITGTCSLDCLFCYRKSLKDEHGPMEKSTLEKILLEMKIFSMPYTVCFGGSGEPLDHPEIYAMMDMVCRDESARQLIIETNGIKADSNFLSFLKKPESSKVKVIVNNNGMDAESYKRLHGADCFESVFQNIKSLSELNSDEQRAFIQIIKIRETDEFSAASETRSYLDKYYDFWESHNIPIILQKQNTYMGLIEDRTYSDLSPVKRCPCWHLQRDLYFLSDGTAAFCKQDIDGLQSRGNINEVSLESIWQNQKESFIQNYSGNHPSEPDCTSCDEWYTFNF